MQTITPFLLLIGKAEEAAAFYTSVFPDGEIHDKMTGPDGSALAVTFSLRGQRFTALNQGPAVSFTPAVSFLVSCETQAEIDHFWDGLVEGGTPQRCGWLTDRYGLSWQIAPTVMLNYMNGPDRAGAGRAFQAMLGMVKLDIAALKQAYEQG